MEIDTKSPSFRKTQLAVWQEKVSELAEMEQEIYVKATALAEYLQEQNLNDDEFNELYYIGDTDSIVREALRSVVPAEVEIQRAKKVIAAIQQGKANRKAKKQ